MKPRSTFAGHLLLLLVLPCTALAQTSGRSLEQSVNSIQQEVVRWIVILGWGAITVYVAFMGLQWAMGDGSAARNWWKPVLGAVLLTSVQWLASQLRTVGG